jgi:hypothetical protein
MQAGAPLHEDNMLREFVPKQRYGLAISGNPASRESGNFADHPIGLQGRHSQRDKRKTSCAVCRLSTVSTPAKPEESCCCEVELFNISPVDCFTVAGNGLVGKMTPVGTERGTSVMHCSALICQNLQQTWSRQTPAEMHPGMRIDTEPVLRYIDKYGGSSCYRSSKS